MSAEKSYDELKSELLTKRSGRSRGYRSAAKNLLTYAKRSGDANDDQLAEAYFYMGEYCYTTQEYYDSLGFYMQKALTYADRAANFRIMSRIYNILGNDASLRGLLEIGVQYYSLARSSAERVGDAELLSRVNYNLGFEHYRLDDFRTAIEAYRTSAAYIKKVGFENDDAKYIAALLYCEEGLAYLELGHYKAAARAYTELKAFQGRYDYTFSDGEDIFIFNILALSLVRKYGDADDVERLENAMLSQVMDSATYLDCIPEMLNMLERDYRGGHQEFVENMVAKGLPVVEKYGSPYVLAAVYNDMSKMAKVKKLPERRIYYLERYFEAAEAQAVVKKTTFRVYMQMVNAAEDIKRKNIILEKQAKTDILTGIPNRFALNDYLQNAFEKAQEEQVFFGLEIFDIDNFKQYNDTYGHQTGDNCLAQVGELLSELVGEHMYAARYGGDEFVILYEGMEDSAITDFAERLKQRVSTLKVPSTGGKTITGISISQGIRNSVPTEWNRSWDYLYTADNALYSVKRKKKGEICLMHRSNFAGSTIDDSI